MADQSFGKGGEWARLWVGGTAPLRWQNTDPPAGE